jgi:hypothetical protein
VPLLFIPKEAHIIPKTAQENTISKLLAIHQIFPLGNNSTIPS